MCAVSCSAGRGEERSAVGAVASRRRCDPMENSLHRAAISGTHTCSLPGADPNVGVFAPLMLAAQENDEVSVKALLAAGARPDGFHEGRDNSTNTPIEVAARFGYLGVLKILVAADGAPQVRPHFCGQCALKWRCFLHLCMLSSHLFAPVHGCGADVYGGAGPSVGTRAGLGTKTEEDGCGEVSDQGWSCSGSALR